MVITSSVNMVSTQAVGPSSSSCGGNIIVYLAAPIGIIIITSVGINIVLAICKFLYITLIKIYKKC